MKMLVRAMTAGLLVFSFCLAQASNSARSPVLPATAYQWIDGTELLKDVDVLESAYTQLHPGLYRYATPAQTRGRFQQLRDELRDGASLVQAYLAFSRFAASIKCGHTYANFHNQPEHVHAALFEHAGRLPFHFRWIDQRMWVVSHDDARLPPGTEVVAIDGVPARDILRAMLPYARADGANDAKRVAQLDVIGTERIEAFDVYLPLLFPQVSEDPTLVIRKPGERDTERVRVQGLTLAQRQAQSPLRPRESSEPAWELTFTSPELAVLRMPDWALYDSPWDWKAFLQQTFETLHSRGTPALVIDLRGNEGGVGVGDVLLSYLTPTPWTPPQYQPRVRYQKVPSELTPFLKTWDPSFKDWGSEVRRLDADFLELTRWQPPEDPGAIMPQAPRYEGRTFVLIGPENSSATFEFARDAQASGLATLVGRPTGGNLRGINGSAFFFLHLPHSGIELDLPLVGQFPQTPQPDRGILPDVDVALTSEDLVSGSDPEMVRVRAMVVEMRR